METRVFPQASIKGVATFLSIGAKNFIARPERCGRNSTISKLYTVLMKNWCY